MPTVDPTIPPASSTSPMRKSTALRLSCASTPETEEATT